MSGWDAPNSGGFGDEFGAPPGDEFGAAGGSNDFGNEADVPMSDGGGGDAAAAGDGACRNCGQEGHFARECTEPKKMTGECYSCGETGHNKADCPNKPPDICRACGSEGHKADACEVNRKIDRSGVADMTKEDAWAAIKEAADDKSMADVKKAIDSYVKADEDVSYQDLERRLRAEKISVFCIAQEMEVPKSMSLVDLQGKAGQEFVIGYFFSPKPKRAIFATGWPPSPEENMKRLSNAGVPMENFVPLCRNCDELGHVSKNCPEDKMEKADPTVITCSNCNEPGHRLRDCTQERQRRGGRSMDCRRCGDTGHMAKDCPSADASGGGGGRACHNCGSEDHMARECDQPRKQTCRNCNEEGHMSKECDKPRNPDNVTCRNCDRVGHFSRDCPERKDWSKVKCSNCEQFGHTYKRCKEPPAGEQDDAGMGDGGMGGDAAGGGDFRQTGAVEVDGW